MIQGACLCGKISWSYDIPLESATACNCTLCRRYGALWAYGYDNERITTSGSTSHFTRGSKISEFHFCPGCGCLVYYRAVNADKSGRKRIAINLRLTLDPQQIHLLPIDHFEGLESFEDLPRDGRCVKDLWF